MAAPPSCHGTAADRRLWLFPAVFAAHVAEECLAGEPFYRWIRRVSRREIAGRAFVAVNLAFEVAMVAVVYHAARAPSGARAVSDRCAPANGRAASGRAVSGGRDAAAAHGAWVAPALGVVGAANGLGHLAGSALTRSYSPGVVSGAALWAPLGLLTLRRARRDLPRRDWRRGVLVGALVSAGVMPLALVLSHRPSS